MNTRTDTEQSIPPAIAEQAGLWDARLRAPDCTEGDRARFAAWRDADPAHCDAFERLQAIVATLRQDRGRADVRALRDEALRAVQHRRRRVWTAAAAASLIAVAAGALLSISASRQWVEQTAREVFDLQPEVQTYSTGLAQHSRVVLADGSAVELNARSRIDVHFSQSQRHLALIAGQALFEVAKNPNKPFVVSAGNREVVAVGTRFDVRVNERALQVTLLEGKVRIEPSAAGTAPVAATRQIELAPGQQFLAVASMPEIVRDIDVDRIIGWREGRIFFEDVSLGEAVDEMNKHSTLQIRVASAALANIRVNGMFKAGEQASFVAALQEYFPITSHKQGEREIVLSAR